MKIGLTFQDIHPIIFDFPTVGGFLVCHNLWQWEHNYKVTDKLSLKLFDELFFLEGSQPLLAEFSIYHGLKNFAGIFPLVFCLI